MNTVVLLSRDTLLLKQLQAAFARSAPQLTAVLADDSRAADAQMAACWFPLPGSLGELPNLQVIHSVAAGIDHLDHDPSCPDLPICRVVDPGHRQGMTEYVRWAVIHYHRGFDQVLSQQPKQHWERPLQRAAGQFKVGVMGLGSLGSAIALDLVAAGYDVRGWARRSKDLPGVRTCAGAEALNPFLDGVELLINLLPLTSETRGILGRATFGQLANGAALVNCGRGAHLNIDDLERALAKGQLRGALLDVFEQEPLPADHRLWTMPGVTITPHMASAASHDCIAEQVAENFRRLNASEALLNCADRLLGY
ncbi:glyoxylate/hydroxypyruvate reductase A [Pseudomonas jessenii]|jgi:glyoxylate/hydroxypyruvate reductase A|uniref:Glyoxylate/hydroxypyruvate reductase A n=1 Tax=Pseudomonas jessenii TaxID=77298 RepID=A0A2W0EYC3_PSEJE|nr:MULTISPECIES: glyoxylate/hydroxypyruvate reductase A [Pseudomonas]PYY68124.1 glyoxylate/hydroxypyruvate reductase A [Pseudomonas jessenii]WPN28541.1 glyoxylate/hydroxypyruvate reductase A [Pseudomonas sp. P5_109]